LRAEDVLEVYEGVRAAGVDVWLDGGCGVDALLQTQTRPHADLDVVLAADDVPPLMRHLDGFAVAERHSASNFVLRDAPGRAIDVHAVVFDQAGNGIYRMDNGEEWTYPAEGFGGEGTVAGR